MYKQRYFIAFYDKSGEVFKNCFDSVRDIAKYINSNNINKIYSEIYYAVKKGKTTSLLGEPMTVYLIDIND